MAENPLKKGRYTQYSNKIGLFSNDKRSFIKNDSEIVLSFPFKDTVLEAGMSKEDQGREERFLHLTMDKKDIDTLEEPKVLTNFRYIDTEGETPLTASSDIEFFDEQGDLTQNLLIKGNNLLALYTLRERLAGKVKLIYIDPPYNTGNDSFKYNDKFNHAAWLTFMKNRLEVARDLLSEYGVIFVQCDYNEQAYLKVLLDEVFGRDNFVNDIVWKRKFGNANESRRLGSAYDHILLYSKSQDFSINQVREKSSKHVQEYIEARFTRRDEAGKHKGKRWMPYPLANPGEPTKNLIYTYKGYSSPAKGWRMVKEKLEQLDVDGRIYFPKDTTQRLQEKKFLDDYEGQPIDSLWTDIFVINSQSREAIDFVGQKPEALLQRILLLATDEGDLVLEFCLGSGTTAAVAHKMNRRWVGIEQMDYIETIAKERLKKVIAGEQGGVSKAVSWSGGGSFVYFELKKYNQEYIDRITDAASLKALEEIYVEMQNNAFLKFWFDRKEFEQDENFRNLDIQQRKQKIIEVLDENQLYLNYADMNDTRHKVTADEKALTDRFYGKD